MNLCTFQTPKIYKSDLWTALFQSDQRGGAPPSQEALDSCIVNQAPGSPSLSFLSFNNSFHGRTMGKKFVNLLLGLSWNRTRLLQKSLDSWIWSHNVYSLRESMWFGLSARLYFQWSTDAYYYRWPHAVSSNGEHRICNPRLAGSGDSKLIRDKWYRFWTLSLMVICLSLSCLNSIVNVRTAFSYSAVQPPFDLKLIVS